MEMETDDEINLLDYWRVIMRRWKIIAVIFVTSVATAAVISLRMIPIYQAKTTIMPIGSSGDQVSAALRSLGSLPFVGGLVPSIGGGMLVAILKSRTMAEGVVQALDLITVFFEDAQGEPPTLQDAANSLIGMTEIKDEEGLTSIAVEYKDPRIAADIANQYTVSLQRYLNKNALSMAKRNRIFIENQLKKVKWELGEAEEAMKKFQTNKKIVAMDAQAEASVSALVNLEVLIRAKEVELGVIKQFATPSNPDVLSIKDELRELKKQLAMVESKGSNPKTEAIPSFSEAPTLGLQYIRLKREALTQEKVFELLTQQYEMAKIEEAKEDITFQVIDRAIPPKGSIKPKRRLNVMLAGVVSLFAGIFLVFFLEYLSNLKEVGSRQEAGTSKQ